MPTYDYRCTTCSKKFTRFESITTKPSRNCPKCGNATAERIISGGGGIIFKGSGFYCTDKKKCSLPTCKPGRVNVPRRTIQD